MKKHLSLASLLVLSLAAGASGCQKTTDLGRVQDESVAVIKVHANVLDQLQRRAESVRARGQAIGEKLGTSAPGIADAGRIMTDAGARLEQLRAQAKAAPAAISTAVKTGSEEEIQKVVDETVEHLEQGEALVRADLDATEQWLAMVASSPQRVAQATPPAGAPSEPAPAAPATPTGAATPSTGAGAAAPPSATTPK